MNNSLHAEYFRDLCYHLLTFNQNKHFQILFRNTIRVSNSLYPDQNRRSVDTELGPNYLQMLSADKERVGNLGNNKNKTG